MHPPHVVILARFAFRVVIGQLQRTTIRRQLSILRRQSRGSVLCNRITTIQFAYLID